MSRVALLVMSMLLLFACRQTAKETAPSPISVGGGSFKHVTSPDGRSTNLTFNVSIRNKSKTKQSGYLFIYAINPGPMPPTRGVWPWPAIGQLSNSRMDLIVSKPKEGFPLNLEPGAELKEAGEIQIPRGRSKFKEYGVIVVDENGEVIMKVRPRPATPAVLRDVS